MKVRDQHFVVKVKVRARLWARLHKTKETEWSSA